MFRNYAARSENPTTLSRQRSAVPVGDATKGGRSARRVAARPSWVFLVSNARQSAKLSRTRLSMAPRSKDRGCASRARLACSSSRRTCRCRRAESRVSISPPVAIASVSRSISRSRVASSGDSAAPWSSFSLGRMASRTPVSTASTTSGRSTSEDRLPSYRIGNRRLVKAADYEAWVERYRDTPISPQAVAQEVLARLERATPRVRK